MGSWLCFIAMLSLLFLPACTPPLMLAGSEPGPPPSPIPLQTTATSRPPAPPPPPTPTLASSPTPEPIPSLAPTAAPAFQLCSPLELHPLDELSLFIGDPYDPPPPGREERHHGVDFAYYRWGDRLSMEGEPVQSILPGTAATVLHDKFPYGNMVIVETPLSFLPQAVMDLLDFAVGESLYVLYAHLKEAPLVALGEQVQICQALGEVGLTGNTDVPHLHLETRLGPAGTVFESMLFYSTRATIQEMENYVLWRTSGVYRHFDPMILLNMFVDS